MAQSLHVGRPQSNRMHVAQLFLLEASCIAGRMANTAEEDPQLLTVPFRFPASLVADRMAKTEEEDPHDLARALTWETQKHVDCNANLNIRSSAQVSTSTFT